MKEDKSFLELFASAVHKDYKFPIFELFAFLYALGTFGFAVTTVGISVTPDEKWIFMLISTLMETPLYVFFISVFKNIAYGLGNDLEKGKIQSLLSYPLKRRNILTAKLLSAVGIMLLLFFGVQLFALLIVAPSMILPNIATVLLTYVADVGYALLLTALILLITLFVKRGWVSLIICAVVYLTIGVSTQIVLFFASATGSTLLLQILALLNPSTALLAHYGFAPQNINWAPTLTEAASFTLGNYLIIVSLFLLAYYYFSRRLSA